MPEAWYHCTTENNLLPVVEISYRSKLILESISHLKIDWIAAKFIPFMKNSNHLKITGLNFIVRPN